MASLRQQLANRPMLGWGIAAVLLIVAAVFAWRQFGGPNETDQLTEMVTIRCAETGDEWQVLRGVMEKELYMRKPPVDPSEGLVNPKTGKRTGFPIDQWKETVARINEERGLPTPKAPATAAAPTAPAPKP
jgi:hypothetical protein